MPFNCWFLFQTYHIKDFKWHLHFRFGVALWKAILRKVYLEGPNTFEGHWRLQSWTLFLFNEHLEFWMIMFRVYVRRHGSRDLHASDALPLFFSIVFVIHWSPRGNPCVSIVPWLFPVPTLFFLSPQVPTGPLTNGHLCLELLGQIFEVPAARS